jgi:hypothetical protein
MADGFENNNAGLESPVENGASVTPNDSTDLPTTSRALWVGTGGTLVLTLKGGSSVILQNVPDGSLLPVRASRVLSTGGTASNIVALW